MVGRRGDNIGQADYLYNTYLLTYLRGVIDK